MNAHARNVMSILDGRRESQASKIDDVLRASWIRSVTEHGLEPDRIVEPDVLTCSELLERRAPVEELSALSSPEMDRLYQRLSEHAEVVMLTDASGVVVHFRSAAAAVGRCSNLRVLPGSIWTEDRQGTTGVGLCLREQRPLSVVMDEHFATKLTGLSCTVAPIFGGEGRLAGVLNVTAMQTTNHALQSVVRELVASSARRIENVFFDRRHARSRVLRLSRHDDFSDGAAEARLALDDSGRIIDATPLAHRLLVSPGSTGPQASLIGRKLTSVAGVHNVEKLLDNLTPTIGVGQGVVHVRLADPRRRGTVVSLQVREARQPTRSATKRWSSDRTSLTLQDVVGQDAALAAQLDRISRVHARGLPLLLQGESGTGKTQLARALHEAGPYREGQFVSINCAAIPAELIESELFGHRPGAFTGASKQGAPGRLLQAHDGTLFLDEIGDMPLPLQARLLHVLSEGEFVPLGGTEPVQVRFALVSASLHHLPSLVRQGRFREDLYYRLSGATLVLPALRERADRRELIERAFARAADDARLPGMTLAAAARETLEHHVWPGNLRELEHVARFAIAVCDSPNIGLQALPAPLAGTGASLGAVAGPPERGAEGLARTRCDRDSVEDALRRTAWNVSGAAALLGVSRATLHRRLNDYGLTRPGGH